MNEEINAGRMKESLDKTFDFYLSICAEQC